MKNIVQISLLNPNSLAQMLRQNGGCKVVVAAPQGIKMELAKKLGAGDVRFKKYSNILVLSKVTGIR
jgi:hypothetical protein